MSYYIPYFVWLVFLWNLPVLTDPSIQFTMAPSPSSQAKKVWNEDLVNGLTARYQQDFQQRKLSQHMWRDAANAIEEIRKDIKLTR